MRADTSIPAQGRPVAPGARRSSEYYMSLSVYKHTHTCAHTHTLTQAGAYIHTHTRSMRGVDEANEASGSRVSKSPRERQRDQTQGGGRVFASVGLDLYWIDALSSSLTRLNCHS